MTQISPIAELEATRLAGLFKYSPDQERDEHGRWTVGGASVSEIMDRSKWDERGHFMGDVNAATYDPAVVRSEYVTQLGKQQIDRMMEKDPELRASMERAGKMGEKAAELEVQQDRNHVQLTKYWDKWGKASLEDREANAAVWQEKFQKLNDRSVKICEAHGEAWNAARNANWDVSQRIAMHLNNEGAAGAEMSHGWQGRNLADQVRIEHPDAPRIHAELEEFQYTAGAPAAASIGKELVIKPLSGADHGAGYERSYYRQEENTIYLRGNPDRAVVFHEMGHWYEEHTPGGNLAALSYLDSRTRGGELKSMNEWMGQTNYGSEEKAIKDKFTSAYTGKIYENGRYTELTSMGMQRLSEDPAFFYRSDRGHMEFTLGMIAANKQGGFPWARR